MSIDDLIYEWTPPFSSEKKRGKLLQFTKIGGDLCGVMLNQDGRIETVRANFLQAVAPVNFGQEKQPQQLLA